MEAEFMKPISRAATSAFLAGLILTAATRAQVPTHEGLVYAVVGGTPLRLDLYIPPGTQPPYATILWIHGGGWSGGSRFPAGNTQLLLDAGFAVASVDYRLTSQAGQYGGAPVTFPAQIHDVKAAVRWLRANASLYRLDRSRFGCWGSSAGGHLSALLGMSGEPTPIEGTVGGNTLFTSRMAACADYFGPTDILMINLDVTTPPGSTINHDAPSSPESRLVGWDDPGQGIGDIRANLPNPNPPYPQLVALCNLVNPITFVDADDPPCFIGHGTADTSVPLRQSTRLHDALSLAGVTHEYVEVAGAGHGFLGAATNAAAVQFLVDHVRDRERIASDLTGDRHVDLNDLTLLLSQFGFGAAGDVNYDGVTDLADLTIVLAEFGLSG
jgi:acetyl esterase/lipase